MMEDSNDMHGTYYAHTGFLYGSEVGETSCFFPKFCNRIMVDFILSVKMENNHYRSFSHLLCF